MLDAYTIRKMLPRLVIGVIGVQLSFYVAGFIIDIFNVLGAGIYQLMTSAIGDQTLINISFVAEDGGFGGGAARFLSETLLVGGAAIAAVSYGILPLLGLALLAILLVFATLIFRQLLIYVLVIATPLAIVAWLLPNTENLARKWFSYFIKALAMYPLIMALFGAGAIFGSLASDLVDDASGATRPIFAVFSLIGAFAPLFLIPFTFQFAGGAIGFFAGLTGGASRAARGAANKRALKHAGELKNKAQTGTLTKGHSILGRSINKLGQGVTAPTQFIPGRLGKGARGKNEFRRVQMAGEEKERLKAAGLDKDEYALRALVRGRGDKGEMLKYANSISDENERNRVRKMIKTGRLSGFKGSVGAEAALETLTEQGKQEHGDLQAVGQFYKGAGRSGQLARERVLQKSQRDGKYTRFDMLGYRWQGSGSRKKLVYDTDKVLKELTTADAKDLAYQKTDAWKAMSGSDPIGNVPITGAGQNIIGRSLDANDTVHTHGGTQSGSDAARSMASLYASVFYPTSGPSAAKIEELEAGVARHPGLPAWTLTTPHPPGASGPAPPQTPTPPHIP